MNKIIDERERFIKESIIEKAEELNNIIDCDVIQESIIEMKKVLFKSEIKETAIALYNNILYRVSKDNEIMRYILSIIKELK